MINFEWKFLELFAKNQQLTGVRYLLIGVNGDKSVETEGNHTFKDGVVNKDLNKIVETDLVQWIEKDTTNDGVNAIKLAIEYQFNALNNIKKVDFPWLAGTFTIE